jgi:probable rRNA maturation factor
MPSDEPDPGTSRTPAARRRIVLRGAAPRTERRAAAAPGVSVEIVDGRGRPVRAPGLARWLCGVAPRGAHGRVTVVLAGDATVRRLNRRWRGVDHATDVLSFPIEDDGAVEVLLGDIVIATGVAARQARERGHPVATEVRVLALHGLLHLLGYDHERDTGQMQRIERRLRRRGGLASGLIERTHRR